MAAHAGQPPRILAADIGGTSCRFAHFTRDAAGGLRLLAKVSLATAGLGSQEGLLAALAASGLDLGPGTVDAAVFAVPGGGGQSPGAFRQHRLVPGPGPAGGGVRPGRVACTTISSARPWVASAKRRTTPWWCGPGRWTRTRCGR